MTDEPFEGLWCWAGRCAPYSYGGQFAGQRTFSVGVFQWIRTADGKGLKRGPVVRRIKGLVAAPDPAFAKASALCQKLNEGKWT